MRFLQRNAPKPITLQLSRDLQRTIKRGHPWVFADNLRHCPPAPPGTPAILLNNRKREIARGFYDANSPLAFRVCHVEAGQPLNDAWAKHQLKRALTLRRLIINHEETTGYRLLNGEGDGLPGLVCDIYNHTAVLRLDGAAPAGFWYTQGIANWLKRELSLRCVYERNRLPEQQDVALIGKTPTHPIEFIENGIEFVADVVSGQKTGFFLDQRENRQQIRQLSAYKKVLNLFGYTGGFSIYAGLGSAEHVTTVDLARPAIEMAGLNWQRNGLPNEHHTPIVTDVFQFLTDAQQAKQQWDLVIIDPPSFASSKKAIKKATSAYQKLIKGGATVTCPDGLLAVSSCSSHIDLPQFLQACEEGISQARRRATILTMSGQPADHPTPLNFSEFRYLKFVLMRVS